MLSINANFFSGMIWIVCKWFIFSNLYIEYKHDRVIADEECSSESNCLAEYITRHAQINETNQLLIAAALCNFTCKINVSIPILQEKEACNMIWWSLTLIVVAFLFQNLVFTFIHSYALCRRAYVICKHIFLLLISVVSIHLERLTTSRRSKRGNINNTTLLLLSLYCTFVSSFPTFYYYIFCSSRFIFLSHAIPYTRSLTQQATVVTFIFQIKKLHMCLHKNVIEVFTFLPFLQDSGIQ